MIGRCLSVAAILFGLPAGADILGARYVDPSSAYGHNAVTGGEYAGIAFELSGGRQLGSAALDAVYEDTAPRLVDLDGDGTPEVITVISGFDSGAAMRIWDEVPSQAHPNQTTMAVVAQTRPIGRRFRWLAIVGAADLDGDGRMEIAYVDRPHLAKTLRIFEITNGPEGWQLTPEANATGFTNHHIRSPEIEGGIRHCADLPEIIVASADWARIQSVTLRDGQLSATDLGPYGGADSLAQTLICDPA